MEMRINHGDEEPSWRRGSIKEMVINRGDGDPSWGSIMEMGTHHGDPSWRWGSTMTSQVCPESCRGPGRSLACHTVTYTLYPPLGLCSAQFEICMPDLL